MSNHGNNVNLISTRIDKHGINENSLFNILTVDLDFEDTAAQISKEIFHAHEDIDDEGERINAMANSLFDVPNFIGQSSCYGDHSFKVIETEFEWIIVIAYVS